MTKDILIQYCDLQEEIKDIRKRICKLENEIEKIEDDGNVTDTVTGGSGGIQHFVINGFPYPEYTRKRTKLYYNKAQLEDAEFKLLETLNEVEEYIQSIEDSRIRRILRFRIVDQLTWIQVAVKMGGRTTDESVKKEFQRFINKSDVCPTCPSNK